MKKIVFLTLSLLAANCMFAQQFSLPIWPEKVWPSEYANYNNDIINCCNYIMGTSPEFNLPKHAECNNFLLRWLEGTPKVAVVTDAKLTEPNDANLRMIYNAGWTKFAIENDSDSKFLCCKAAVEATIKSYKKFHGAFKKSSVIENLIKLQEKEELDSLIRERMAE